VRLPHCTELCTLASTLERSAGLSKKLQSFNGAFFNLMLR
jgi:hypothetical protein